MAKSRKSAGPTDGPHTRESVNFIEDDLDNQLSGFLFALRENMKANESAV